MIYKNVTYTPKGQFTPTKLEKDWTSISFSSDSLLIDDLSQYHIEPSPSDGGSLDPWWEPAAGTKKDFENHDLIYRLKRYQWKHSTLTSKSILEKCFLGNAI